jgi:cysteine-rich secretory family protein/PAN domain-containing protein
MMSIRRGLHWVLTLAFVHLFACTIPVGPASAADAESGIDRPGGDYKNFDLEPSIAGFGPCQSSCESDGRCKTWTFVKPGVQGSKARCWLKDSIPNAVRNNCCVSGVSRPDKPIKTTGKAKTPPAGGGGGVPADWNEMLKAHNDFRKQHCSPALQWDATLAKAAQTYAETGSLGAHGASNENLANALSFRTTNGVTTDVLPAKTDSSAFQDTWACEEKYYKYDDPKICGGFKSSCDEPKAECNGNPVTGHYTQVVWKAATKVGCGRATRKIQDKNGKTHDGTAWVCRYDTGNTNTPAALRQNVLPLGCTP